MTSQISSDRVYGEFEVIEHGGCELNSRPTTWPGGEKKRKEKKKEGFDGGESDMKSTVIIV